MLAWIKRFALGLDEIGVAPQRSVLVFSPNHIFVPMVYLSVAGSGRHFTGANPSYTVSELAYQMRIVDAAVVFVHPSLLDTAVAAAKEAGIPLDHLYLFSDKASPTTAEGIKDWRSMTASKPKAGAWEWDALEGDRSVRTVAAINFSSGTTGLPKGVCITHHNLVANAAQTIYSMFAGTEHSINNPGPERWLAFLPLYHAYSQLFTINIACKLQVPVYVMPKFGFKEYLEHIQQFKISRLHLVPPVLVMLAKRPETLKYRLDSVKHVLSGAAPLSQMLQNDVMEKFPSMVVAQGWGMTETTCAGCLTPGMTRDLSGSIGPLLPNTEALLVDEDGKEVVDPDAPGELWLRGPQITPGYWRNEQATRESLTPDGWLKTGDVAMTDGRKWRIVDRRKELIKVNGLQVAPAELEAVLLEHEGVSDAAVVGIMIHEEEFPRAYVVADGKNAKMEKDIHEFVAGKVAKHKRLVGGIKFVDEIPKLASGKIMRKVLREWAKQDANEVQLTIKARI
jgi:acyl-CoA synthetase (AMP-forming)/AMP-acid ligase II